MEDKTIKIKLDKKRLIIGIILGTLALVMTIVVFMNKDAMFPNGFNLTYPDGCVETYMHGKQITPNCTIGRQMLKINQQPVLDMPPGIIPNGTNRK